ncbi:hypothetical protein CRUP_019987, partial [Coryphaenoides rupestris]
GSPRLPVDCEAGVPAEVVLVVDGSWSIGRTDFRRVREFLEGVASRFRIGPNHVRFGQALLHVMEETLGAESGARQYTPLFLILLTDGKSQDDVVAAANRLKGAGVEIIGI